MNAGGTSHTARAPGLASRQKFVTAVRDACEQGIGLAAGKLGDSERGWLQYPILLEHEPNSRQRRAYELVLGFRSLRASGIFPTDTEFLRRWCEAYVQQARGLDWIGMRPQSPNSEGLASYHALPGTPMAANDQQPDRSCPSNEERCYLPALRGRRLLLVSPFARLLKERATKSTFEAVWAKTGKPWFEPASVEALEVPYGFAAETQARYGTALDLFEELKDRMQRTTYDVALIGAGGLGDGLACVAKERGKIGISLGGHLQVVFGVLGARWSSKESWRDRYFNDAWIAMPARYVPAEGETCENYW